MKRQLRPDPQATSWSETQRRGLDAFEAACLARPFHNTAKSEKSLTATLHHQAHRICSQRLC